MENYDYNVIYKTGKTNVVADALSRKTEINANELDNDEDSDEDSMANNSPSSDSQSTNSENTSDNGDTIENSDTHDDQSEDLETVHSANTSDDYFIKSTERPINYYRNQIILRLSRLDMESSESPFPNFKRVIINKKYYDENIITTILKKYHNGKQMAILAPEPLINLIQNSYKNHFSNSGYFVITHFQVEDIRLDDKQDEIIRKEHERAHCGITEVENQLRRSFFFPKMVPKIRNLINSCNICSEHKYDRKPYNIKISPRPLSTAPFERVHMDIFGIDKHYYLSLICAFSKHLQLIEILSRNVVDIQKALTKYFGNYRTPKTIICDHEASFTSIQLQTFLSNLGTKIEFASSSESNGQIEKTHSTVIELFNTNKYKFPELSSPEIIGVITNLYNETIHSSTSFTPNEIIFNQQNLVNPEEISTTTSKIFSKVRKKLSKARKRMKKYNNSKEDPPKIEQGENVYVKKATRKKLDPRFTTAQCIENADKTFKIRRNVKRHKNKIKRLRK